LLGFVAPKFIENVASLGASASLGENAGRHRRVAPQTLSLQHDGPLAVLAQTRRIDRHDDASRVGLEVVGRVVAKRGPIAEVDAPGIADQLRGRVPTQVGLAQGVDVLLARLQITAPVDEVEPVGKHRPELRRDGTVVAEIDRRAPFVARTRRVAQPRVRQRTLAKQPPGL
jgi:hypothetical protein